MDKNKKKPQRRQLTFRVSKQIAEEIEAMADQVDGNRSAVIRDALKMCFRPREVMGLDKSRTYF
jgi:predicted transcriptional regulator